MAGSTTRDSGNFKCGGVLGKMRPWRDSNSKTSL
jgi:hypothetical protein